MNKNKVYILGGYQTDFTRNWARENKHISAMMREAFEGGHLRHKDRACRY